MKSRVDDIVDQIRQKIESRILAPGSKLPSIRQAAIEFDAAKNTVIEAYDRLVLSGLVASRAGSGFTVIEKPRVIHGSAPKHVAEAVDIASLLSAQLEQSFKIRVGDGRPPASWTEESEVRRYLGQGGRSLRSSDDGYGSAYGYPGLRDVLARELQKKEIAARPEQILTTFGANHALDLIIRRFLVANDTVLVDDPGYYPLFAKLKLSQVNIVGVRRTPSGPDVEDFSQKVTAFQPKMFFTQSLAHNPTGGSTNLPTAHALLNIASINNMLIVEDEPFIDLPTVRGVGLAPLDQLKNVICVRTFAKTLSASLRTGFIAAREDLIASLAELKMLTTVNSSGHVERLLYSLISEGHYKRHLSRLSHRIEAATSEVIPSILATGAKLFCDPTGGYYVYVILPAGVQDIELAKAGVREGIFIAPGSVFSPDRQAIEVSIRVNIGWAQNAQFYKFLERVFGGKI
jgi:DNA-binding transcriptional MocR family regulator